FFIFPSVCLMFTDARYGRVDAVAGSAARGTRGNGMKRYMIVDDSAVVRLVASRILAGPEHYVREAACGRQALEISSADMPEVMIVNWTLPDMSALDRIAELRAMGGQSELPRIAVWLVEPDVGAIMRAKRA